MKPFSPDIKAKIRFLYIDEGKSALDISKKYKGNPSPQTIAGWAKNNGWDKDRKQRTHDEYEKLSPQHLANKLLKHISDILNKKKFTTKDADALAKLRITMEKIVDKKFQIPMMYELLTKFINFLNKNYPDFMVANEEIFYNAVLHFKNEMKAELEGDPSYKTIGE